MEAYLSTKELWEYVDGTTPKSIPADSANPTAEETKELAAWKRKAAKASGEIWLAIDDSQKVHVKDLKGNPQEMWKKLEGIHVQRKPGTHFNAYESLLSIRKRDDESLSDLMTRASKACQDIKALRPSTFTLDDLDNELLSMALICALPADYNNFASSLLLLDSLSIDKLKSAFHNEESQRTARQVDLSALAFYTLSSSSSSCFFCGGTSHFEKDCNKKKKASEDAKHQTSHWRGRERGGRGRGGQQNAKEANIETGNAVMESAGHASALSSSDCSGQHANKASTDWNPDTGASKPMTPHRRWFCTYSPHVVPIRLADHSIIWSEGLGSVMFQPKESPIPVIFHDVLHVPALGSNLLSVFHLTRHGGYKIGISDNQVLFHQGGKLIFTATVDEHNVGHLNGHTIIPQSANLASTRPLDLNLWHCRLSHLNYDDVRHMHQHDRVTGMVIRSTAPPDPICEPCIFGKQHRHNIPKTATRKSSVLALVHTDLKGPMPVQTPEGYQYWQPFVDDQSHFMTLAFLRCKNEAFPTFKRFKALAEKQTGCKLLVERDDKGGEFIGKEFFDFCADEGILRQHSEPNEPHQNGVSERASRDITAATTALLVQAKLPASFWALAAATYVHTRNRSPTSALNGETPYFYWKNKKPDVSYLRVFGCLAYVLIHKNHRKALEPHSKRCIFVGYAEGVKAWKFWDPVDKKIIISSHAVFDERYFPGNSTINIKLFDLQPPTQSPLTPEVVLHQGGESDNDDEAPANVPNVHIPPIAPLVQPPQVIPPNLPPHAESFRRQNPGRASRFTGSLKESDLQKRSTAPVPPAMPPASSLSESAPMPTPSPPPNPLLTEPVYPGSPHASDSDDQNELDLDDGHIDQGDCTVEHLQHVYSAQYVDYLTYEQAMDYAFSNMAQAFSTSQHDNEPRSFHEAMQRPLDVREKWYKAAEEEIKALVENGTFDLVQLPPGKKAIGSRWVFKVKRNANGSIEQHKARFVAQGFAQRPGFDYTETFAPTPKWAALRAVLAIAAYEDLELESVDISSAYLNGNLDEEVYLHQPEGFVEKGDD